MVETAHNLANFRNHKTVISTDIVSDAVSSSCSKLTKKEKRETDNQLIDKWKPKHGNHGIYKNT